MAMDSEFDNDGFMFCCRHYGLIDPLIRKGWVVMTLDTSRYRRAIDGGHWNCLYSSSCDYAVDCPVIEGPINSATQHGWIFPNIHQDCKMH
jgi:hypothetical protein